VFTQIFETHKYNVLKNNAKTALNWTLSKIKNVEESKKAYINFCVITIMGLSNLVAIVQT
jgi:hypothetical protein